MQELDELIQLFGGDSDTLRQMIERNPNAKQRLANSETVFKALVEGDQKTLETYSTRTVTPPATTTTAAATTTAVSSPAATSPAATASAFDYDALIAKLDERNASRYVSVDKFGELADKRAQEVLNAERPKLITSAINFADEVYTLRNTYETEFPGKKFDRKAFETFVTEHPNHTSLTDAFNAMVSEDRIAARIAKGVTDGIAARETTNVPGGSLPTAQTMLGAMMRKNAPPGETASRGNSLDQAAAAFRQLRSSGNSN